LRAPNGFDLPRVAAVAAAGDTSTMLAPAVARYIAQHRLYATILPTENPD
jgi:hypothetical protein